MIAAIIQAHVGTGPFAERALRRIGDATVLAHVIARAKAIPRVETVIVATTAARRDDAVVHLCRRAGARWVRGDERDVLSRYVLASESVQADVIVRLTSDCPLVDPLVAGAVLDAYRGGYASNVTPSSFFDGADVEVFSAAALRLAHRYAIGAQRQHVTAWMRQHPDRVRSRNVATPDGSDHSALKLSIDTVADYRRICRVYAALGHRVRTFGWRDVVAAYAKAYPDPAFSRAAALFGSRPVAAPMRAAYVAGVRAATVALRDPVIDLALTANPFTTEHGQRRQHTAFGLGWEDVMELGRTELMSAGP